MIIDNPIAIVSMAGVFPGASTLDRFWQNILNRVDTTHEVPANRWIVPADQVVANQPMPDKALSNRACLIDTFEFDPDGLDIDPGFVETLDPLYHLVLHAGRDAFKACRTTSVDRSRVGTILAAIALPTESASDFARATLGKTFESRTLGDFASPSHPLPSTAGHAAQVTSLPAALLAQGLALGGGTYTIDAACASSLYAVKLACDELLSYRSDMMIAGGVSRPDCLYTQIGFSQLQALSPTGRCAPFDASANGLVVGEGVGIVILKRLSDALDHGDTIFGIIRGIGLANDMGGSLLAPDSEGQVRAMRAAYKTAGWRPSDVDLIECHGAGTPMGDATELQSLATLWAGEAWRPGQCGLGSVKSMIGHLLTAAGAAGLIKTLLAINAQTRPPSLKFNQPAEGSPLVDGPWRVITEPEEWKQRSAATPRRTAVSAFGFGGINAHLLVEEWMPDRPKTPNSAGIHPPASSSAATINRQVSEPVAIVGIGASFGRLNGLRAFQESIFKGESCLIPRPEARSLGKNQPIFPGLINAMLPGGYVNSVDIETGQYHIPPKEIPDIIPQHLLMLQVAAEAMADANMPERQRQPQTGVIVGVDFDFEATNFALRWDLWNQVRRWQKKYGLTENEATQWLETLREACGPPLTATRTLGALAGVIASRIAKEFLLGGPSFVVSNAEASGLKALNIAVRSIQQNETDTMVVGAVDFTGDWRRIIASQLVHPFSRRSTVRPFDARAEGTLPGEGAVAIVLKRLDKALNDKERIYSVVQGLGNAHQGDIISGLPDSHAYVEAMAQACQEADTDPASIGLIETHGSGRPREDALELQALSDFFPSVPVEKQYLAALGSLKPTIGHPGAASGLASVAKASLCLFHELIPALINYESTRLDRSLQNKFQLPARAHYWFRDRSQGPRRACVNTLTSDGNCSSLILEAVEHASLVAIPPKISQAFKKPTGLQPFGLFAVCGETQTELLDGLDTLSTYLQAAEPLNQPLEATACQWHRQHPSSPHSRLAVALTLKNIQDRSSVLQDARQAIANADDAGIRAIRNVSYTNTPLGRDGEIAFVFPGSGNHYLGMGRRIGIDRPEILRQFDFEYQNLASQHRPRWLIPHRSEWLSGWETEAAAQVASDPLHMIFGQVVYGGVLSKVINHYGIKPSAVIGYSLGESAGLFATGAWSDRDAMLNRMLSSDLFSRQLSGPCLAVRSAWGIPAEVPFEWSVAVVNRSAAQVRQVIKNWPHMRLLIVNTPDECVIGGELKQIEAAVDALQGSAFFLDGVVTVHCDAALPVRDAYEKLHVFPVTPPDGVRFYSCAQAKAYHLTRQTAAASIAQQAIDGFDFPKTILQAYADGLRIFLEMGPQGSCTRMIRTILADKPYLAVSASRKAEHGYYTVLKLLAELIAHRLPVNMDALYGVDAYPPALETILAAKHQTVDLASKSDRKMIVPVGSLNWQHVPPPRKLKRSAPVTDESAFSSAPYHSDTPTPSDPSTFSGEPSSTIDDRSTGDVQQAIATLTAASEATAAAHQEFLEFSDKLTRSMTDALKYQSHLLRKYIQSAPLKTAVSNARFPESATQSKAAFSRDMCLEFAIGSVGKVLGPEFDVVDTYKARVRLPDEPLMLVDRILSVQGEKRSLGSGKIVTEHDVRPDAWYLDGGRAPVCISVEAGQADLFLCSYLGIDHKVKGQRTYRLLDATVEFHRDLPEPGDVLRYEIEIEKFVKQGQTHLFFFNFKGYANTTPLLRMTNGCAGFFTESEVAHSGGIILTPEDLAPEPHNRPDDWLTLAPPEIAQYDDHAIEALRQGDLERAFGNPFKNISISKTLCLPGGRMRLIDRVRKLDPDGGRYGLGMIQAEADIHPDDWFLTCHFMDDMVMPGTLMYECCAHTLRVFVQRLGWVTTKPDVHYGPVPGIKSVLKCRGPVTPKTKQVVYEVEIKAIGYRPEPYVLADAHMYADGHRIVMFQDMSLQMFGIHRDEIESLWRKASRPKGRQASPTFDKDRLREFCRGKPSKAFGDRYAVFDQDRFIARLPSPPYAFIDRVMTVEPPAWILKPDGWIEAEFDIKPDAWYFRANRTASMPYCVLNEVALQACGWLAAYMGSALGSKKDLRFRNLGGDAVILQDIQPEPGILTTRARLTQVSEAGEMIIEHFEFVVTRGGSEVFKGNTHFGFFTEQALAQQVGIREDIPAAAGLDDNRSQMIVDRSIPVARPLTPDDDPINQSASAQMPATALSMFDKITTYRPEGGPHGCGHIRGVKRVDPHAWFFNAHFYQDPVCPGSLGLESLLQLLKFDALERWGGQAAKMRFAPLAGIAHQWMYRGQILPTNREVAVDAIVTETGNARNPFLKADGFLHVDGLCIYKMQNFGIRMVPL